MNGFSIPIGLYLGAVAILSAAEHTEFPAVPVVGTLAVLLAIMKVVEQAKKMAAGYVTQEQLEHHFLKFEKQMDLDNKIRRAVSAAIKCPAVEKGD